MDLSTLETKQIETLHVKGPDGEDTDIKIQLYSADTDIYDEALAEMRDTMLEMRGDGKITAEQRRTVNAVRLARCTKNWEGLDWQGEELPFSFENAKKLYANPGLKWLTDKINAFIERRENFLGN